ncbi:MAG: hypothetical protein WBN18_12175 [Flavobacteriaceae bacterium]
MNAENDFTKIDQTKKVDQLYLEIKQWKSALRFMLDEIHFIDRLLNSYVFEPNTPNLFERLLDYQERVKKAKAKETIIATNIKKHESNLGGMLECTDDVCDLTYYQKHSRLKAEWAAYLDDFQNLKSEIFNYAGAILKRRKPDH